MHSRPAAPIAFLISAALAGCTAVGQSASAGPTSSLSPSLAATPTPTRHFIPPTVATFRPSPGPATDSWSLVALGDSNVAGWGINSNAPFSPADAFPGVYAASLADQQGVTVTLHSYYPDQIGNEVRTIAE